MFLGISFAFSIGNLLKILVGVYVSSRQLKTTVSGYVSALLGLGEGTGLEAIKNNQIVELNLDGKMQTVAQVRLLVAALVSNTSVTTLNLANNGDAISESMSSDAPLWESMWQTNVSWSIMPATVICLMAMCHLFLRTCL